MIRAAVDEERRAGDEPRVVRGEKHDGRGDVVGYAMVTDALPSRYASTMPGTDHSGSVVGVRTSPGATALTRIPRGPSSSAATSANATTPALAAQ